MARRTEAQLDLDPDELSDRLYAIAGTHLAAHLAGENGRELAEKTATALFRAGTELHHRFANTSEESRAIWQRRGPFLYDHAVAVRNYARGNSQPEAAAHHLIAARCELELLERSLLPHEKTE